MPLLRWRYILVHFLVTRSFFTPVLPVYVLGCRLSQQTERPSLLLSTTPDDNETDVNAARVSRIMFAQRHCSLRIRTISYRSLTRKIGSSNTSKVENIPDSRTKLHRVLKKVPLATVFLLLTLPNADGFSKFFHRQTSQ